MTIELKSIVTHYFFKLVLFYFLCYVYSFPVISIMRTLCARFFALCIQFVKDNFKDIKTVHILQKNCTHNGYATEIIIIMGKTTCMKEKN